MRPEQRRKAIVRRDQRGNDVNELLICGSGRGVHYTLDYWIQPRSVHFNFSNTHFSTARLNLGIQSKLSEIWYG
jgi:hypothetical protein